MSLQNQQIKRNRYFYLLILFLSIATGLFIRSEIINFPNLVDLVAGDILYAFMAYWLLCFLLNKANGQWITVFSFLYCVIIEFLQFYHAPWINAVRATRLGGLVLGYGFLWSDILAYALGVLLGYAVERLFIIRFFRNRYDSGHHEVY